MLKKTMVVQSNSLVEARYRLTNLEQRLIFSLISKIRAEDDALHEYDISLKELSQLMGIDLADAYKELVGITKHLMSRVLSIRSAQGNLVHIHWLCRAEHKQGSVVLSFMPDLKPYLLQLKSEFTICDLAIITGFGGKYTIRLYMLLRQYTSIGWRGFELKELREILGIEKDEYREYKRFSQRVLAQAKKEMEAIDETGRNKCDLTFEVETIREGRKITRLKFIIIKNNMRYVEKAKAGNVGKSLQKFTDSAIKPPPIARQSNFPEYWDDFLKYIEKKDPGLLPIIASDGPECMLVKAPYIAWSREFKQ
ncbi:replication initiation protein [Desulfobulbus sp. F5]|nr:replication initiation protein [Desulfobulbus sp. F5]